MSLTTRTIPQLFNGVSRQPPILRSIDQTESELNSWAMASAGVGKRPPTEVVAKLTDGVGANPFIHIINRDTSERYVVVIDGGTIKVIGFDGVARTVNTPGGTGYLAGNDLSAVTVADYTFIVNRAKPILMKAIGADTAAPPAYVRDPVRTPVYDEGTGLPKLPGRTGGYGPNPALP
jgi:hypothetical protein